MTSRSMGCVTASSGQRFPNTMTRPVMHQNREFVIETSSGLSFAHPLTKQILQLPEVGYYDARSRALQLLF